MDIDTTFTTIHANQKSRTLLKSSHPAYRHIKARFNELTYLAYTISLFPQNDIKTVVVPSLIFALFTIFNMARAESDDRVPSADALCWRLPAAILWAWLNTLAFTINNQRQAGAIEEDRVNKPWRPIPAGRLTHQQAELLGSCVYPIAILASLFLGGGFVESVLLLGFGYLYNDMRYGDTSWLARNMLNACGVTSFAAGALEVLLQGSLDRASLMWLLIIAGVIGTTIHIQDMYDQPGDAVANRKTVPLVVGDGPARLTIAVAVIVWSCLCPLFWAAGIVSYLVVLASGVTVALRSLTMRSVEQDRTTSKWYNLWLVCIYSLPALKWLG